MAGTELWDVACADAAHAWAVGSASILATTDGGATWKLQTPDDIFDTFDAVACADSTHAWALGMDVGVGSMRRPYVHATTDGGATWKPSGMPPDGVHSFAFTNANVGWCVSDSGVYATSTGGSEYKAPLITLRLTLKLGGLKGGVIRHGKRLAASGVVTPSVPWPLGYANTYAQITAQRKSGKRWVTAMSALYLTIWPDNQFGTSFKLRKVGSYRIKAAIARTDDYRAGTTKWLTFRVK
jgi:hypothetical protein